MRLINQNSRHKILYAALNRNTNKKQEKDAFLKYAHKKMNQNRENNRKDVERGEK